MLSTMKTYQPTKSKQNDFWHMIDIPNRGEQLYTLLSQGLALSVFNRLAELSYLDKKQLAQALAIAPATLQRRAKLGQFNLDESDKLFRFATVFSAAIDLFEGDMNAAALWLKQPVRGLGEQPPLSMLITSAQTQAVLDLIGRLEHGVHS